MLWGLIFVAVVLGVLYHKWKMRDINRMWNTCPGTIKSYPLIGHGYMFIGTSEDRMNALLKLGRDALQNDGISKLQIGTRFIVLAKPELIEIASKCCLEKDDILKCARYFTGNGNVFAPVPIWRPRRKIIAPIFSPKNLNRFVDIFSKQSKYMAYKLGESLNNGPFSIWNNTTTYAMDSIFESNLGVKVNAQKNPDNEFLHAFDSALQLVTRRLLQPWLHPDPIFRLLPMYQHAKWCKQQIYEYIDNIIHTKRKEVQGKQNSISSDNETTIKSFLELLLESSYNFTNVELREEMTVIAMAGTDTSAVGIAFTILMLARYPEMQEKVYQEVRSIFGDSDRNITHEDLPKLQYLDYFIRETLRLYPPVPVIIRKVTKDVSISPDITLVKNSGVMIHLWATHRNPQYWGEDAEVFRPERFEKPLKHPAQFVAFSYGPRNCLGYQYAMISMKTAVSNIIRKFKILPPQEINNNINDYKPQHLRLKYDIMMKDADNFLVSLEERS